jgi:hypothetical protein
VCGGDMSKRKNGIRRVGECGVYDVKCHELSDKEG